MCVVCIFMCVCMDAQFWPMCKRQAVFQYGIIKQLLLKHSTVNIPHAHRKLQRGLSLPLSGHPVTEAAGVVGVCAAVPSDEVESRVFCHYPTLRTGLDT